MQHDWARMKLTRVTLWLALTVLPFAVVSVAVQVVRGFAPHPASLPWTFQPWEIGSLVVSFALYVGGLSRLWAHAGIGRGVKVTEAAAFVFGLLAIGVALVSPLDDLSDSLFSAHMVGHELLMVVAAPLLVLGRPLAAWVWAAPSGWRGRIGGFFARPGWRRPWLVFTGVWCAWWLHALALWLWHLPVLFEAALHNEAIHAVQHICFLGTALIFWWSVLGGTTRRARGLALLSIFATMVHTGALGALFTLSTTVWYPTYAASAPQWGLTALEDQQLGGIIMWVPSGVIYMATGLFLSYRWLFNDALPNATRR